MTPVVFHLEGVDRCGFDAPGGARMTIRRRGSPLTAAARAAVAAGHDPAAPVAVLRDARPALTVSCTLGKLARLDVLDAPSGARFVRWRVRDPKDDASLKG